MAASFTDFYVGWEALAIVAAAGSVIISIMLIMFARLFDQRQLEDTAKKEFIFAASSVFIVIFSVLLINQISDDVLLNGVAKPLYWASVSYCPNPDLPACQKIAQLTAVDVPAETMIDIMLLYMDAPMTCIQKFLDFLYVLSIPIEACASLYMEVFMSEQMGCFGLKWVAERITNTVQSLTFYTFIYYLIVHSLTFIKYYAGFFFSIGVILRALPPTRGAGAYVMAISIGLYFVLPFSYILVASMTLPYVQSNMFGIIDPSPDNPSQIQYSCGEPAIGSIIGLECGTDTLDKQFQLQGWLGANKLAVEDFFNFSLPEMMRHMISVICILPLVAFTILFSFILNTTNLFGGNIPEIGRGLIRLI